MAFIYVAIGYCDSILTCCDTLTFATSIKTNVTHGMVTIVDSATNSIVALVIVATTHVVAIDYIATKHWVAKMS
jgi:hypothetical protein